MQLTFHPDKCGSVGGADSVGCDTDVLAVVRQGDLLDGQPRSRHRLGVADDRIQRRVGVNAAEWVPTPPRDVRDRPTPAGAVQLEPITFNEIH